MKSLVIVLVVLALLAVGFWLNRRFDARADAREKLLERRREWDEHFTEWV